MRSLLRAVLAGLVPSRAYARPSTSPQPNDPRRIVHRRAVRSALGLPYDARSSLSSSSPRGTSTRRHSTARPYSSSSASPVLAIYINAVIAAESLRMPATAVFFVSAASRCASGQGRYDVALRSALGAPRCAPHCVLLRQARQRVPHRRGLLRRALLHALAARDGVRMPHRHSPASPRRLHRPLRSFNTTSWRCARTTSVVNQGDAAWRPSSLPLPSALNRPRRPRAQPRQRAPCCVLTLPLRLTMHSAAPRGAARRRLPLLPDNSEHAPIPRRPAPPVLPRPLPDPGPSLAHVLAVLRVLLHVPLPSP